MACDHPCALVSGVGPCLHLRELSIWSTEYGIWIMEFGIQYKQSNVKSGTWNIQYGARREDCRVWRAWGLQYEEWSTDLKSMVWSMKDGG